MPGWPALYPGCLTECLACTVPGTTDFVGESSLSGFLRAAWLGVVHALGHPADEDDVAAIVAKKEE